MCCRQCARRSRENESSRPTWSVSHGHVRPCAPRESCTPDRNGTAPRTAVTLFSRRRRRHHRRRRRQPPTHSAQRKNVARPRPACVSTISTTSRFSVAASIVATEVTDARGVVAEDNTRPPNATLLPHKGERLSTRACNGALLPPATGAFFFFFFLFPLTRAVVSKSPVAGDSTLAAG